LQAASVVAQTIPNTLQTLNCGHSPENIDISEVYNVNKRKLWLVIALGIAGGCSPEAKESLQDLRGTLPKALRGDAKPLEEYPVPSLSGSWADKDFPQLKLRLTQSGNKFTVNRDGDRGKVIVREQIRGTMEGRAVTATYINNDPNKIRPVKGKCSGAVSVDSTRIQLTCTGGNDFGFNSYPLNFQRK